MTVERMVRQPHRNDAGGSPNVVTIRRLRLLHRLGEVDRMILLMHPDVVWRPLSLPGVPSYEGHEGVRQMLRDLAGANRPYKIEYDAIRETGDDLVEADAWIVAFGDELAVRFVFKMRDELVYEVDTYPRSP